MVESTQLMNDARFATGLTYEAYKAQMKQNRERFEQHEKSLTLDPADVAAFKAMPKRNVVVLTEDWCSDAVATLPLLAAIAQASGTLDVRIFFRDQPQNADIRDSHLNRGKFQSIPMFVFFDEGWRELGTWWEKAAVIYEMRERMINELYASEPSRPQRGQPFGELPEDVRVRLSAGYWKIRDDTTPLSNQEVLRELRELLGAR